MLIALGLDPAGCGYTGRQVAACLQAVVSDGVHQESEGAQQLSYMLAQRGVHPAGFGLGRGPRPRPEVLKLRFDSDKAPLEAMPTDLREPIFKIMLQFADGALERRGQSWSEFDPIAALAGSKPRAGAPSDGGRQTPNTREASSDTVETVHLGELTWPEAKERFGQVDVALLPVGAIEQHGPHLPLDTDAFDAAYLAREVAAACSAPRPVVLPLISYGVSYHHEDFAGTISIGPDTLARLVHEIGMSAARNGIKKLVVVNGHGGNNAALHFAAQLINRDARIFTCVDSGETSDTDIDQMAETQNDVHAGEIETSTSLALRPDLVQLDKAKKFVPKFSSHYLDFTSKRSVTWYTRTARISTSGVLGDPTKATREKGERMWAVMIKNLVELVEHLKQMSLREIYQTKY
jgi:mycofactocin system creatininase family protein